MRLCVLLIFFVKMKKIAVKKRMRIVKILDRIG